MSFQGEFSQLNEQHNQTSLHPFSYNYGYNINYSSPSSSDQTFLTQINHNLSFNPSLIPTPPPSQPPTNYGFDKRYFDSLPSGYRFLPTDAELLLYYLKKKVWNQKMAKNKIMDVNLYDYNPEILTEKYKHCVENECWYFFTPRDKKYANGKRPRRSAGDGFWKATGSDNSVKFNGELIGYKRTLVFHVGPHRSSTKTNWIMQEYRVADAPQPDSGAGMMRLDDWVLCKVYKHCHKSDAKSPPKKEEVLASGTRDMQPIYDSIDEFLNFSPSDFQFDISDLVMDP